MESPTSVGASELISFLGCPYDLDGHVARWDALVLWSYGAKTTKTTSKGLQALARSSRSAHAKHRIRQPGPTALKYGHTMAAI